jgi:hypothetical protein
VEDNQSARRDLVPFFSRRIGLSSSGQPITVFGGARLTGRAGRQTIGLLTLRTDEFEGDPGDTFTAARLARDLTGTASVSGFYFGRESSGSDPFNRVVGGEVRLRPTRTVEIESFAMHSSAADRAGDWAGRAGFRLDANAHRARAGYVHVGESFRHDLGFVRRAGIGTLFSEYTRVLRPGDTAGRIREYTLGAEYEATADDQLTHWLTRVGGLSYGMLFADGAELRVYATSTYERLDTPFGIGPDLVVPPGIYDFEQIGGRYETNPSAALSASVELTGGEFWTGHQRDAAASVRYRFNAHLAISGSFSRANVDLPDGTFVADLAGLRIDWSFTPRMFLNAFVQYNGETDTWLSNGCDTT